MKIYINNEEKNVNKILSDTFEHLLCQMEELPQNFDDYDIFIDNILYKVKRKTPVYLIIYENCRVEFRKKQEGLIIDQILDCYIRTCLNLENQKAVNYQQFQIIGNQTQGQQNKQQDNAYKADKHVKLIRVPILSLYSKMIMLLFEIDQENGKDKVILIMNYNIIKVFTQDDPENELSTNNDNRFNTLSLYFDHHNTQVYWNNWLVIEWGNGKKSVMNYNCLQQ